MTTFASCTYSILDECHMLKLVGLAIMAIAAIMQMSLHAQQRLGRALPSICIMLVVLASLLSANSDTTTYKDENEAGLRGYFRIHKSTEAHPIEHLCQGGSVRFNDTVQRQSKHHLKQ
jgi:hypothetical protein